MQESIGFTSIDCRDANSLRCGYTWTQHDADRVLFELDLLISTTSATPKVFVHNNVFYTPLPLVYFFEMNKYNTNYCRESITNSRYFIVTSVSFQTSGTIESWIAHWQCRSSRVHKSRAITKHTDCVHSDNNKVRHIDPRSSTSGMHMHCCIYIYIQYRIYTHSTGLLHSRCQHTPHSLALCVCVCLFAHCAANRVFFLSLVLFPSQFFCFRPVPQNSWTVDNMSTATAFHSIFFSFVSIIKLHRLYKHCQWFPRKSDWNYYWFPARNKNRTYKMWCLGWNSKSHWPPHKIEKRHKKEKWHLNILWWIKSKISLDYF